MFDPREFVRLAEDLAKPEKAEAEWRTAIGRAYYGCFLFAWERVPPNRPRRGKKFHKEVHDRLNDQSTGQGGKLLALYKAREKADYRPEATVNPTDCSDALLTANDLIRWLEREFP